MSIDKVNDIEVRTLAREIFHKCESFKDNPIAWSAWKMAFDTAYNIAWEKRGEKLYNMIMPDGDIFEVCKNEYINEHSALKHTYMNHYLKGAKMQRDYWQSLLIKPNTDEKKEIEV